MTYFSKISNEVFIPKQASSVYEANWRKLHMLEQRQRKYILRSSKYTHIFFWKNVVERFVSGYFDEVVDSCQRIQILIKPVMTIHYYSKYGFSCEKHSSLEGFISYGESS